MTGQDDIIVGTPVATRNWPVSKTLVSYCVNTLPLRTDVGNDPSVSTLVARTSAVVCNALEHQDFPFPLMVERLQPERAADRSPIFQVMFVYQRAHVAELEALAALAAGSQTARMPLGDAEIESHV